MGIHMLQHPVLVVVMAMMCPYTVSGAVLTVKGPNNDVINIERNNTLALTCGVSPGNSVIVIMRIGKLFSGNSNIHDINNIIIEAVAGEPLVIRPGGYSLRSRMTIAGMITDETAVGAQIQIILKDLRCSDAGQYFCYTYGKPNDETNATTKIIARGKQLAMEMLLTPRRSSYDVGDRVEIRCTGDIGDQTWLWRWRSTGRTWTAYPNSPSKSTNGPSSDRCPKQEYSTLIYYVKKFDNGLQFQCAASLDDSLNAISTIYITHGPESVVVSKPEDYDYLPEMANLTLTCTADARPEVTYIWYYEGQHTSIGTSQTVTIIPSKDRYTVICRATNTVTGEWTSGSITLLDILPQVDDGCVKSSAHGFNCSDGLGVWVSAFLSLWIWSYRTSFTVQ